MVSIGQDIVSLCQYLQSSMISSPTNIIGYSDEMLGKWKEYQGLKKVASGCLGQEDFPAGLVTCHSHVPDEQGIREAVLQLSH